MVQNNVVFMENRIMIIISINGVSIIYSCSYKFSAKKNIGSFSVCYFFRDIYPFVTCYVALTLGRQEK